MASHPRGSVTGIWSLVADNWQPSASLRKDVNRPEEAAIERRVSGVVIACASCALPEEAHKEREKCYRTWDDACIYLAFKVDCPDVGGGKHSPPRLG